MKKHLEVGNFGWVTSISHTGRCPIRGTQDGSFSLAVGEWLQRHATSVEDLSCAKHTGHREAVI